MTRRADIIRKAAYALCEARGEDPDGKFTRYFMNGKPDRRYTYLEQAEKDVETVLEDAVPGFLDGNVVVGPPGYFG